MSSPKRSLSKSDSSQAEAVSPPKKVASPPKVKDISPPKTTSPPKVISPPLRVSSVPKVESPLAPKQSRVESFRNATALPDPPRDESSAKSVAKDRSAKEVPFRTDKLSLVATEADAPVEPPVEPTSDASEAAKHPEPSKGEETNGVGDKIKIFEKAAEDAASGRQSRPGSIRRRTERLPSDELPPPPPPVDTDPVERQQSLSHPEPGSVVKRWQFGDTSEPTRPEPQRIVRPEFRLASPAEVTIRSPSLGTKAPERFPSHGTAFRNVSTTLDPPRPDEAEDTPTFKTCKVRTKDKCSVSRGSSYFTRGSEEIWLVKKKDIEEIEERVLDSFRRAGARGEGGVPGSAGTLGRGRRPMYARSESLEPTPAKAHTLKRQASVACTCGHDKKTRARSADTTPRPRSRSHGDDNNHAHVLDKYETLV